MLKRDQHFLLTPDFADTHHGDRAFFCPRRPIVDLLGEAAQACPVLVMSEEGAAAFKPPGLPHP